MAKEKFKFYLMLSNETIDDKDKFQKNLESIYVNGVKPIQYHEDTILDEHDNVVQTVILLECEERWKGAAKRYFRKANFEYMNHQKDNLPIFA